MSNSTKIGNLFWGRMAKIDMPQRIGSIVLVVVAIASLSFCQLGFWPLLTIDGKAVYLMLILGPLFMGTIMFGPLMGGILGLYTGAVLYAHAAFYPLDFYEVYFMTPLNTFVLFTILGVLSSFFFTLVTRRLAFGGRRLICIAIVSIALSLLASALMAINTIIMYGGMQNISTINNALLNSPRGVVVQALLDAVLIVLCCCVADTVVKRFSRQSYSRALLSVFRNWMFLVSVIVFMTASAIIFSVTTSSAEDAARSSMLSESDYLAKQANALDDDDFAAVLDGYDINLDGLALITNKDGVILASDSVTKAPVGDNVTHVLGYDSLDQNETPQDFMRNFVDVIIDKNGGSASIQATDDKGSLTLNYAFIAITGWDDGYAIIVRTAESVYETRLSTMIATTLLAVALLFAIALLATVLLNRVVVRRIDETNESLLRITGGNLNERVGVRDSREFWSLSSGINTTVSTLRDTIEEVEQRNAQDLATAKAIQESALPRTFPPFPEIDKFDIYASMKTAKEVGGDFYNFFLIEGTEKLGFVMADVSGKGIPAALFMMAAKTQLQSYMESGMPLDEAVNAANHQLCISNDAGMFVTVWAGVLDYSTGFLEYVNAGHNPPLILHDGVWGWIKDVSGMPLGLFDGVPYELFTYQMSPGDMLYTYTDGVTEAMDANDEMFGEDRLVATLYKYATFNPRSVGVGVRRAITDFTLDANQSDDITMLLLKYGVPPETRAVMVLPADDDQLVHVYNFIHEELRRRSAPKSVRNPLDIAAEELFVNVCHYAYPDATPENPGEVRISFEYQAAPPALRVTIEDDGIPYNPLAKPDAVTPSDIKDVPIGGLGILMAKRSVDEMTYERKGNSNVLSFVKQW